MYKKAYGIIETLAPVHVGASAGEETGNLNLIFRDQFTQTGIIPGSSIRGRFRADMQSKRQAWLENKLQEHGVEIPESSQYKIEVEENGKKKMIGRLEWLEKKTKEHDLKPLNPPNNNENENYWYGHHAVDNQEDGGTTEALVKFEYASLVWLPVFCPGQPIVWVSCPWLLRRYKQITGIEEKVPEPYTAPSTLQARPVGSSGKVLFFNLGFLKVEHEVDLNAWIPEDAGIRKDSVVVVDDNDMAMIHDMALYRQSRIKMMDEMKKVDTERGAFFNVEALPEGCILIFPIALKEQGWQPFGKRSHKEMYFGGLESIGFGRCDVMLKGEY
ncbi:MAG: type III-B CRISPR module RAMP protein Cmr4 [Leptolyngbya sp. SIO4C1]|nr:type III-B CRISPR module RAMP protein Cmr4 [Leptolyngbya sp. SIO4C1]